VLHGTGNNLYYSKGGHRVQLFGKPTFGVLFFESTEFSREAHDRAKSFALIIAGSTWNREILEQAGIGPVDLVLQGG
jgi:hypothetical protein